MRRFFSLFLASMIAVVGIIGLTHRAIAASTFDPTTAPKFAETYRDNSAKFTSELLSKEEALKRINYAGGSVKNVELKSIQDAEDSFGIKHTHVFNPKRQVYSVEIDQPKGINHHRVQSHSPTKVKVIIDAETGDVLASVIETDPKDTVNLVPFKKNL